MTPHQHVLRESRGPREIGRIRRCEWGRRRGARQLRSDRAVCWWLRRVRFKDIALKDLGRYTWKYHVAKLTGWGPAGGRVSAR